MQEVITMSKQEANQIAIFEKLEEKKMKQVKASKLLGISTRQIRRKLKRYRKDGVSGLVHQGRGKPSNNQVDQKEIDRALNLIEKKYPDFGPTFAHEKLVENHGIKFSIETLRKAMIAHGIWKTKSQKKAHIHQMRERRSCEGELVQIDGSPHDWFEGRGDMGNCTLLVFVDDATSKLLHLEFVESESTWSYFGAMRRYLSNHGKPVALYSDKHGVFRVNTSKGGSSKTEDSNGLTQFGRAMKELDIEPICANTPQAKGRVERANLTLQDRLVKEMRLLNICSMEEGNAYLPEFINIYNKKFGVVPKSKENTHRSLLKSDDLDQILTKQDTRVLSKNLTCQYDHLTYQIKSETARTDYKWRNTRVTIQESHDGSIKISYKGKLLSYTTIKKQIKSHVLSSKLLNHKVDQVKAKQEEKQSLHKKTSYKPSKDHPWRRPFLAPK
jgi:transposase